MEGFIFFSKSNTEKLPRTPGVYIFKNNKEILYIGKATDLKERIKNHFQQPNYRDNLFLDKVKKIGFLETGSEIGALLLEASLIKKHRPRYNIMWRDDKNYFYVVISKEKPPFVSITHQPKRTLNLTGPFVDGTALKKALRLLRKAFPYYSSKKHPKNQCLWCHLGLCPGPDPDLKQYKKSLKNLTEVLRGKKSSVLEKLRKEMKSASKSQDFEKAARLRDQIRTFERIMENARVLEPITNWQKTQALFKKAVRIKQNISRIEGYDISNIQGQEATGSMVVFINGLPNKSLYRKFKIKIAGKPNDTAMIREVISRRLRHSEWPIPELMLIDGGKAQLNAAIKARKQNAGFKVVGLAKRNNELFIEGEKKPIFLKTLPREVSNIILQIRDESHRFAVAYHHRIRRKNLLS